MVSSRAQRWGSPLIYVLFFVAYLSVLIRMLLNGGDSGVILPPAYGLMAGFLALSVAQPPLSRLWLPATHIILVLQSLIVIALLLTRPRVDFYAMLFIGLSVIAARDLPDRVDLAWLGVFCALCVFGLAAAFGAKAAGYLPSYIAGCLIVGLYGRASRKAEAARARSDELRIDLEAANRRLLAYAERAEESAAAQERAALARDLHDAATQTVFSINLTAEAARIAVRKNPSKVIGFIDRIQELSRDALGEMRTLVRELRPGSVVAEGLVPSLRRLATVRQRREGLSVALSVNGSERGEMETKETIFRTAREALNNIAKHAGVSECRMKLSFDSGGITLLVQDTGRGFDPAAANRPECFGLRTMRERVESQGGTLDVRSAPGSGTEVVVRLPLAQGYTSRNTVTGGGMSRNTVTGRQ
jgi:signal transduction histidine kinase